MTSAGPSSEGANMVAAWGRELTPRKRSLGKYRDRLSRRVDRRVRGLLDESNLVQEALLQAHLDLGVTIITNSDTTGFPSDGPARARYSRRGRPAETVVSGQCRWSRAQRRSG